MTRPSFSPAAREDLLKILDYIAADAPNAAVRFVASLEEKCNTLVEYPEIGRLRPDLAPSLRSIALGNYVIYYRPFQVSVRIERVLHGARDVDALLGPKTSPSE